MTTNTNDDITTAVAHHAARIDGTPNDWDVISDLAADLWVIAGNNDDDRLWGTEDEYAARALELLRAAI